MPPEATRNCQSNKGEKISSARHAVTAMHHSKIKENCFKGHLLLWRMVQWLGGQAMSPQTGIQFPLLPQTSCVTLHESLGLRASVPCLQNGSNSTSLPQGDALKIVRYSDTLGITSSTADLILDSSCRSNCCTRSCSLLLGYVGYSNAQSALHSTCLLSQRPLHTAGLHAHDNILCFVVHMCSSSPLWCALHGPCFRKQIILHCVASRTSQSISYLFLVYYLWACLSRWFSLSVCLLHLPLHQS